MQRVDPWNSSQHLSIIRSLKRSVYHGVSFIGKTDSAQIFAQIFAQDFAQDFAAQKYAHFGAICSLQIFRIRTSLASPLLTSWVPSAVLTSSAPPSDIPAACPTHSRFMC
jgi:hypothetical protein